VSINYEWVLDQLNRFLEMSTRVDTGERRPQGYSGHEVRVLAFASSEADLNEQAAMVQVALKAVFPDWEPRETWRSFNPRIRALREDVLALKPQLTRAEEIQTNLGPDPGPIIAADSLHPWIWDAARPHWESGNFRAAVHAASTNLNSRTKKKSGRPDLSEGALLRELFSLEGPAPGKPRLRRTGKENPDHFKNAHLGAMNLGLGLFSAVRNPVAHLADEEHDLDEQEALECLAAFSLLARWIDRAEVHSSVPEQRTTGQAAVSAP
jgi:hypothetical protein